MKTIAKIAIIGMAVMTFAACDVDRTGENSVEISTDTAATAEAAHNTETAMDKIGQEASEAAQATETALREGAQKTGTALEEAGKEIQEHSKPGNQP